MNEKRILFQKKSIFMHSTYSTFCIILHILKHNHVTVYFWQYSFPLTHAQPKGPLISEKGSLHFVNHKVFLWRNNCLQEKKRDFYSTLSHNDRLRKFAPMQTNSWILTSTLNGSISLKLWFSQTIHNQTDH